MLDLPEFQGQRRSVMIRDRRPRSRTVTRCIVGFDFREWNQNEQPPVTSLDPQVWKRIKPSKPPFDENGLNLYEISTNDLVSIQTEGNERLVAFDLPVLVVEEISSTFGVNCLPIETVADTSRWSFLGFDVVDARTQCSAFYSFDWTEMELADFFRRFACRQTPHGLVADLGDAVAASDAFDDIVPEHAPFAPCGVWVAQVKRIATPGL